MILYPASFAEVLLLKDAAVGGRLVLAQITRDGMQIVRGAKLDLK